MDDAIIQYIRNDKLAIGERTAEILDCRCRYFDAWRRTGPKEKKYEVREGIW